VNCSTLGGDARTPLVTLVETGTGPDAILAAKFVNDTPRVVAMTRPLCLYPRSRRRMAAAAPISRQISPA